MRPATSRFLDYWKARNEDDAVSVTMSMFSDNDELASLIAQLINADKLIILTDIDGLYTLNFFCNQPFLFKNALITLLTD